MAGALREKQTINCFSELFISQTASYWLVCFEDLLSHITSTWDGMVVLTGDINFDLIGCLDSLLTHCSNTLDMFEIVMKLTRVTKTSRTLIDYKHTHMKDMSRILDSLIVYFVSPAVHKYYFRIPKL